MLSRPKATNTNTATSKKRSVSKSASNSIAKRPHTQGGFVLSSDDDDDDVESADDDEDDCCLVPSKSADQKAEVSSKAPASTREPLPAEPTKAAFPSRQLNKARLSKLLGRNGKLKQTTRKVLPPSTTTQSPQQSVDTVASNEPAEPSNNQATLLRTFGNSLLGVKHTVAPHPQPPHAAISAVEVQSSFPQQEKSTYTSGDTAPIKAIGATKVKETTLAARSHVGIGKEKSQQKSFPALKLLVTQAPTNFQSDSRSATLKSTALPGVNPGSKAQEFSKPETKILQSQTQHKENESKTEQQVPKVCNNGTEPTKPDSCSSEQPWQKDTPDTDNDGVGDTTTVNLQKPVPCLPSTPISPRIEQEDLKSKDTIGNSSEKVSGVAAAKILSPVADEVTPEKDAYASSEVLVLSRCELSKEAQPYFEYSILRKDWSSEQDEKEAQSKEIIMNRFTNVLEANTQAEKLFQGGKHPSYMIVECSTKRDEHGCIVLTKIIAPFDQPAHKYHTKIYVQRDYVSKFANQTLRSLKGTTFISNTAYILRLFRLIEVPDAVNSNDSDSDSNSHAAAASDPIRVCHPHDRPEVYTTLETANRAAKNLQVQLSHIKDPKDAMNKAFQEQDLRKLEEKVRELESAGEGEDRFWRSKFNASGLGGNKFELVVEKVGICGPRNI